MIAVPIDVCAIRDCALRAGHPGPCATLEGVWRRLELAEMDVINATIDGWADELVARERKTAPTEAVQ